MTCPACGAVLAAAHSICPHCGGLTQTEGPRTITLAPSSPTAPSDSRGTASGSLHVEEGAIVANRYRVMEKVGKGGMGAVYKVHDLTLDRVVALKTIHPQMAQNPRTLESFKKELILARQVTHKNVCRVFDMGQDGGYFLTMEFVDGQSLGRAFKLKQKWTPKQAAEMILQIAEGLEAAHETGIVHRDLKLDNIMIEPDGRVLVMDFGIARPVRDKGSSFAGTPGYASPEQLLGKPLDRRSDLFSLGVIFYKLLCGESPFPGVHTVSEARELVTKPTPPLTSRDSRIPKELSDIVARCMAIRPEDRFATARELAQAIGKWLHPQPFYSKPVFAWSAAAGIGLIAIAAAVWSTRPPPPALPPVSLLIADFENNTREQVFDGSLEAALQVTLEGASFITAYDRGAAKRLIAQLRPGQPILDEKGARLVADREGIAAVLSGSIERDGSRYRLTLRTIRPSDGKELVREQHATVSRDGVLVAAAGLAAPIRRALGDATPASQQSAAAETYTAGSLEAANRYSTAQELASNPARREEAARAYEDAIRLDPNLGRAYAGLAVVYRNQNRPGEALKTFELALAHTDRMSEREKLRTRGGYYITSNNPVKAAEEFGALVREFPADTGGHSNLALALLFLRQPMKALEEGRKAVDIYPRNLSFRTNVALYALYAGNYQTATREASAVLKEDPRVQNAYIAMALSELAQQHSKEAQDWYLKLARVSPNAESRATTGLADLAVAEGRLEDAVKMLLSGITADEAAKRNDAAAHKYADLAQVYVRLNRKDDALHAAARAAEGTVDLGALMEAAFAYIDAGAPNKAAVIADSFREKVGEGNQVAAILIEGYGQMASSPVNAMATFGKAQNVLDTWLGHFLAGRASLLAKAYVQGQAELESCVKRSGEATAVFLDEVPTARLIPPVWFYLAQSEEALNARTARDDYQRFLAYQAPQSQDPLATVARNKIRAANPGGR